MRQNAELSAQLKAAKSESTAHTCAYKTAMSLWNSLANQLAESELDCHRRLEEALHTTTMQWHTQSRLPTHAELSATFVQFTETFQQEETLHTEHPAQLEAKLTTMEVSHRPQLTNSTRDLIILVESSLQGFKTLRTSNDNVLCTKPGGHQSSSCLLYSSYTRYMWVKLHKETSHKDRNI